MSRELQSQSTPSVSEPQGGALNDPRRPANPRTGYIFAGLNAIISGFAIFINSQGVKSFPDSTLYTAMKNAVVGICVLAIFLVVASSRTELRRLRRNDLALLLVVAVIGGALAYALDFRGLQISTPVTAALIDHMQFLYVGLFAALLLHERFSPIVWVALGVLFVGLSFGITVDAVRWDAGVPLLIGATLLFAFDFIIIKHLLRTVSLLTVMLFKMTLGSILLLGYVGALGHLGTIGRLNGTQWGFVLVTGLILLAFTITSIAGLRHASATAVIAIGAGSPIITTILVVLTRHVKETPAALLGLGLVLVAVLLIFTLGQSQEVRRAREAETEALAAGTATSHGRA